MKGLRIAERVAAQLLAQSTRRTAGQCVRVQRQQALATARCFATSARKHEISEQAAALRDVIFEDEYVSDGALTSDAGLPSPLPEAAHGSAKLAALHARLNLPESLPLDTLARTLVDVSADPASDFNNASLAQVGSALLSAHVSEWLIATYPRLPMAVLYAAMNAYVGPATLKRVAQEWGVDSAAAPGSEVDPGYLQYNKFTPGVAMPAAASARPNNDQNYRRGMSSRVVYDDEFGDEVPLSKSQDQVTADEAHAQFVRALTGALYLHGGKNAAKDFVRAHILSRHLPIEKMFAFKTAARDLSRLCAREGFEFPVARMLSETGRHSRHPVYVVGVFSGTDKLGEGAGASMDEARTRAAIAALKAWYLYSPNPGAGTKVKVPSDVENGGEWKPVHVDIGEIVAS
jgi:dsRNA-specific ribonuclease